MSHISKQQKQDNKSKQTKRAPKKSHPSTRANKPTSVTKKVRGRGGYAGDIGSSIGGSLGMAAGNMLSSIFGMGDYEVKKNSLTAIGDNGAPSFNAASDGSVIVAHREFLRDVSTSVLFSLEAFEINPGLANTFPWLSNLAINFEEYQLLGLIFEFKTTSGSAIASTNTALGTMIMATDYNPDAVTFTNKKTMEQYQYSCSAVPCTSFVHPVECAPAQNVLGNMFVRNGPVPFGEDRRFYDQGLFQIATVGAQAASVAGELWVSYHVKLIKPKLPSRSIVATADHFTAAINGNLLGLAKSLGSGLGCTVSTTTGQFGAGTGIQLNFPEAARYMVICQSSGSSALATVPTISTPGAGVTQDPFWNSYAENYINILGANLGASMPFANLGCWLYTTTRGDLAQNVVFQPSLQALGLGTARLDLVVFPFPTNLTTTRSEDITTRLDALIKRFTPAPRALKLEVECKTIDGTITYAPTPATTRASSPTNSTSSSVSSTLTELSESRFELDLAKMAAAYRAAGSK